MNKSYVHGIVYHPPSLNDDMKNYLFDSRRSIEFEYLNDYHICTHFKLEQIFKLATRHIQCDPRY